MFAILLENTDIKDTKIDKIKHSIETVIPPVQTALDEALQLCSNINDIEIKHKYVRNLLSQQNVLLYVMFLEQFIEERAFKT